MCYILKLFAVGIHKLGFYCSISNIDAVIERKKEEALSFGQTLQPLSVFIGTLTRVNDAYVVVDDFKYRVKTPLAAIDLVFKISHAVDCKYQQAALNTWLFIQHFCYEITVNGENINSSLYALIEDLKAY